VDGTDRRTTTALRSCAPRRTANAALLVVVDVGLAAQDDLLPSLTVHTHCNQVPHGATGAQVPTARHEVTYTSLRQLSPAACSAPDVDVRYNRDAPNTRSVSARGAAGVQPDPPPSLPQACTHLGTNSPASLSKVSAASASSCFTVGSAPPPKRKHGTRREGYGKQLCKGAFGTQSTMREAGQKLCRAPRLWV
jgi:hypothetical protein